MKVCKKCNIEKPEVRFYYLGYFKKRCVTKAYSSYCKECNSNRINKRKTDKPYKPQGGKNTKLKDFREKINIEVRSIYILLKRIEINNYQVSYIDCLKLIDEYIKVFANDIPDYYTETEQLDMMYFRLEKYIKNNLK